VLVQFPPSPPIERQDFDSLGVFISAWRFSIQVCHLGMPYREIEMPIKFASHLYRNRHGTFYFRFVIPQELRQIVQKSEVRFSLHTEQRFQAIISAMPLIADLPHLTTTLRRMADDHETPPLDYFQQWRAQMLKNSSLTAKIKILESDLAELQDRMAKMVPIKRAKHVAKIMLDRGQLQGKQELEDKLIFPWLPEKTALFSTLKASYLKSLTNNRAAGGTKKPPTEKTLGDYDRTIELFITVMGNCHIGAIDREVAGEYFSILKRLPANMGKKAAYRGKSIPELLAMNPPPQSETTCSQKIERLSTMFKWALEEKRRWGIDANPFIGYGQSGDNESSRRPFTTDEIRALLNHPDFKKGEFRSQYSFWLIPLATYTGARLGELAQLDLKDFVEVDGISCIDINDVDAVEIVEEGGRKKRVKTKNAKRLVPIHPELIRIGILRHVEKLRQQKVAHLFPELSRTRRDGPAQAASNWFGRFRKSVGLNTKQETVFHSFRHLFITNILDAKVPPHMLAPIVGHEAQLITGQVYWHKKNAAERKPTVDAFSLPEEIRQLFPSVEDVTFVKARGPKSSKK
jgi:integrase